MGNKTLKWQNGQEMLVKCVMDNELDKLVKENNFIGKSTPESGGYRFYLSFSDRQGENVRHLPVCISYVTCAGLQATARVSSALLIRTSRLHCILHMPYLGCTVCSSDILFM